MQNRVREHYHHILHIWNSIGIKFQLIKLTILGFWTKFAPKKDHHHQWKTENVKTEFCNIRISLSTKFQLNLIIFIFLICPKRLFPIKHGKGEHLHRILHIQISLSTKFKFKLTILIFWTKFAKKGTSNRKWKKWISPLNPACSSWF